METMPELQRGMLQSSQSTVCLGSLIDSTQKRERCLGKSSRTERPPREEEIAFS